jgi:Yip1 domain
VGAPTDPVSPIEPVQPSSQSTLSRLVGVFFSPGSTFEDVGRKPDFWAPLVVIIVFGLAFTEAMIFKIGMDRIVRMSMEQSGQAQKMSPDQLDNAVRVGAKIGVVISHLIILVGLPVFLLILAAIGMVIVNLVLGGQISFKKAFSVACYANVVGIVGSLMGIALVLFGDPENFNAQSPIPSSLAFFLNPLDTSKTLMAAASSVDVITIWMVILFSLGISKATGGKQKTLSILLCVCGVWAVWILAKVGFAALTGH